MACGPAFTVLVSYLASHQVGALVSDLRAGPLEPLEPPPPPCAQPWFRPCRVHVENPPHPDEPRINVLAFGDSWAEAGPSFGVLQQMFQRRGVNARVEVVASSLSMACTWAANERSLVEALDRSFPKAQKVDYVWFSLGGNDYMVGGYDGCMREAGKLGEEDTRHDAASECLKSFTVDTVNRCSDTMLTEMWKTEKYKDVKVLQVGYEFRCHSLFCDWFPLRGIRYSNCIGEARPDVCENKMSVIWNEYLLGKDYHTFGEHAEKYTGVSILGATQSTRPAWLGKAGEPNVEHGATCNDNWLCVHPRLGTPGADAIAEAFWTMYFEKQPLQEILKAKAKHKDITA